jgi:hypothetical protein
MKTTQPLLHLGSRLFALSISIRSQSDSYRISLIMQVPFSTLEF